MIDSLPSSAESSFRELDEVFLQTQTRIWLGELLNTRLDEDLPLCDLLQDGEMLFEVSKVVWDLLLTKCMELHHLKDKYGPFRSKRSSGRYRPYSNVDSFLKICKILGLSGIDLFSPSDVVEKRDIRKVCICIRALSKKVRSKQLAVPDFDMVMHSVSMPTDMVGVIRKSLESSPCTFSSSSSYSSRIGSQMKLKQRNLSAQSITDDESCSSEESDEAESRYMGENSVSSARKLECADGVNSLSESSPEKNRISGRNSRENGDICNHNFNLENDVSFMGDSSCIDVGESNYISDYLAFSDLMVHATDGSNSVVLDGENNMFDFFLNVDSQRVTSDKSRFQYGSQGIYSEDEEMEVSSTTSMSSVLGRLLNLELDNQFDEDDSSSTNVRPNMPEEDESEKHYRDSFVLFESSKDAFENQSRTIEHFPPSQDKCEVFSMENPTGESYGARPSNPGDDFFPENSGAVFTNDKQARSLVRENKDKETVGTPMTGSDALQGFHRENDYPIVSDDSNTHGCVARAHPCETIAENHPCSPAKDTNAAQEDTRLASNQHSLSSTVENGSQDKRKHGHLKNNRRPLLKTVFKGTAVAGFLFLLLQFTKSKGNNAQNAQISKNNESKPSSTKQQTTRAGSGMYPTGKIKL